jgi:hypothetical protein
LGSRESTAYYRVYAIPKAHPRALAHLHQFSGHAALSTWLIRIVIDEALMRRWRRAPSVDLDGINLQSMVRGIQVLPRRLFFENISVRS